MAYKINAFARDEGGNVVSLLPGTVAEKVMCQVSIDPPLFIPLDEVLNQYADEINDNTNATLTIVSTPVTTTQSGLMTPELFDKLDGIAYGATNYVHPTTHPASMIETDSNRRFLTDAQIAQFTEATSGGADVRGLQESITHIVFQLALQDLINADEIGNVIVDVIDSENAVTIVSGRYADNRVFI